LRLAAEKKDGEVKVLRQSKLLAVDYTREESFKQILPGSPMLSSPKLDWEGIGAFHYYCHHPAHETPEHYHNHHILHIHLSGAQGVKVKLDTYRHVEHIRDGNIFITPANVNHSSTLLDENSEFIVLDLDPKFISNSTRESIELDGVEIVPCFTQSDPLIYQLGLSLKAELTVDGSGNRFYAESLFSALSAHLLRKYASHRLKVPKYEDGLPRYKLQQAIAYINAHLDQDIRLADLAKTVGMSQYYFCRLFRQSVGVSPYQYVIGQRVERAKQLLEKKDVAIADVALACGFANQDHLTKMFRRLIGMTPKAYRDK
jgi:AraC family transcriptional regulator